MMADAARFLSDDALVKVAAYYASLEPAQPELVASAKAAPIRPDPVSATADFAIRSSELPADLVVAAGAGNQRLYVIPSRGLTIVRLASFDMKSLVSPRALSAMAGPSDAASRWSDTDFLLTLLPAKN